MRGAQTQAAGGWRAEVAVLGAVLLDNAVWPQAAKLNPGDLALDSHRRIYSCMRELREAGRPVDMITLVDELNRRKELDVIGGVAYLSSLIDGVPERPNIEYYIVMVRHAAGARQIALGAEAICELADKGLGVVELRARLADLQRSTAQYEETASGIIQRLEDVPDIYSLESRAISYVVPEFIPCGTVTLVTGAPGVGKSMLALKLGVACALGREVLGRRCEQISCAYFDRENPLALVQHRMHLMAGGPIHGLFIWGGWNEEEPPSLEDPRLLKWATEHHPLFIFDSLVRFHAVDENSASEMRNVMAHPRRLADAGASVLLLHHRSKSETNKYRGSSDILAAVDMAYALEQVDGGLRLHRFKSRFSAERVFPLRADFAAGTFELLEDTVDADERGDGVDVIVSVIMDKPGATTRAICVAAQTRGVSRDRTLNILKQETGRLWRREPGARGSQCYYALNSVPCVPPYREEEHRNGHRSQRSETNPRTAERTDNKTDDDVNSVVNRLLRNSRCETEDPEHSNLPETRSEQSVQPVAAAKRKERFDL